MGRIGPLLTRLDSQVDFHRYGRGRGGHMGFHLYRPRQSLCVVLGTLEIALLHFK